METEKILFFRNFLFTCLIVGIGIAIIFGALTLAFWDTGIQLAKAFFNVDERVLGELTLNFFLNVRIVLIFLFLVPAIALHRMAKGKSKG